MQSLPALQNAVNNPNAKSDNFQKRARAPIEQLRPFSSWSHFPSQPVQPQPQQQQQQVPHHASNAPQFAALRRRNDDSGHSDLRVASSQDSRRSENEDNHAKNHRPIVKELSREYSLPFLYPRYDLNLTGAAADIVTSTLPPPTAIPPTTTTTTTRATTTTTQAPKIIINVPDVPTEFTKQNEINFSNHKNHRNHNHRNHQQPQQFAQNRFGTETASNNLVQGRIVNQGSSTTSINAIPDERRRPLSRVPANTPTPFETNELLPVVPAKENPEFISGLLPPFDRYPNIANNPTTELAIDLEPPLFTYSTVRPTTVQSNQQIPVLPPVQNTNANPNSLDDVPELEKDLLPPIYDWNSLTFTRIRIPYHDILPPTVGPPTTNVNNNAQSGGNHTFPSLTPLHGHVNSTDKAQTQRSVPTASQSSTTNSIQSTTSSSRATTKEINYLDLQKEFLIPTFEFPLETVDERPSYESNNVFNSFQVKLPDGSSGELNHKQNTGNQWYGENAQCPECHPSFLKPGTCEPCIKFR